MPILNQMKIGWTKLTLALIYPQLEYDWTLPSI